MPDQTEIKKQFKKKYPGRSLLRSNGVLRVNSYLRLPYTLMCSNDFLDLTPVATKVYLIILRQWRTNAPDNPVTISIDRLRELMPNSNGGHIGRNQIQDGIKQLQKFGFIHKVGAYKQCNEYWIEQKWFTGEYV